jgi:hypothetical protein
MTDSLSLDTISEDKLAYADDLTIIVQGNSGPELERRIVLGMSDCMGHVTQAHNLCI